MPLALIGNVKPLPTLARSRNWHTATPQVDELRVATTSRQRQSEHLAGNTYMTKQPANSARVKYSIDTYRALARDTRHITFIASPRAASGLIVGAGKAPSQFDTTTSQLPDFGRFN